MVAFSIIIVTHGRHELLMKCLDSLRPGTSEWQLVIFSNGEELPEEIRVKAKEMTPHFTELYSEKTLTPGKARNIALESVNREWVFFIDDDAYVLPGYWEIVLPLLQELKIDVLGGPDSPAKGMNAFSLSVALSLSSPFCTGATAYRHKSNGKDLKLAGEETLTSCNLWIRKNVLDEENFPEDYLRAEEVLLLQKLKAGGKKLYYHPKLKVAHFRRSQLKNLFRPSFYAGFYRSRLMKRKMGHNSGIYWLPAIFVLLHLLIIFEQTSFWYLARMYVSIIGFVSIGIAMKARKFWLFPIITFMHYFIVFMYGLGFLWERVQRSEHES